MNNNSFNLDMNIYLPINISELEYNHIELEKFIKLEKTFIINGKNSVGKTTIIKLYLNYYNFDYNIVESDISYDDFMNKYKFKSKSIFSYLFDKKYSLIIKNFENFDDRIKEFIIKNKSNNFFIIITHKYLNDFINYVYIYPPSFDYLSFIYLNIYFIETGKYDLEVPDLKNFYDIYNFLIINFNTSNHNILKFEKDLFDNSDINKIIHLKNFQDKLNYSTRLESNIIINNNLIYNYEDIDDIVSSYEYILDSFNFYNFYNESYYEIFNSLNIIGALNKFDKNKEFKIIKTYLQNKKKIKLNYIK
tara:strand:- start:264 stop:1178 length:915 start_codon:yes stop_codon:yes gene_type:complete